MKNIILIMRKLILILTIIYFIFASIYVTYPLIFNLEDSVLGLGDELLITWIINWDIYAFAHFPLKIFDANIFYPYHNSLSFSDAFFTSAAIAFLPVKIFKEPAIAYNVNLLFSFSTLGFFTYLLVYYFTKNNYSSIISGTLFAFSTYTLEKTVHLQLLSVQWIPLTLLFFFRFINEKKYRYLIFSCIFFVIQVYNSFLPGYFLIVSFMCLLLILYIKKYYDIKLLINKNTLVIISLSLLVILPIAMPYLKTSSDFNYVRDIRESIHTANRPEYFLYAYGKTRLKDLLIEIFYKNNKGPYFYDGYLGFAFIVLSIFAIFYRIINRKKYSNSYFDSFLFIGIFSFVLSLGPVFQWGGRVIKDPFMIPLPYAIFYYILPGFKGFRNSGRWEMLMMFAFSVMIGLFLAKLYKNKPLLIKVFMTLAICFLVFAEFTFPLKIEKIPKLYQFPPVYSYINTLPSNAAIIELPIYNWNMQPYSGIELKREYFSTVHFRPMVNGGSGFSPIDWQNQTYKFMLEFPSEQTIKRLKDIRVKYLIFHKKEYDKMELDNYKIRDINVVNWKTIQDKIKEFPEVKYIKNFGDDYVYELVIKN